MRFERNVRLRGLTPSGKHATSWGQTPVHRSSKALKLSEPGSGISTAGLACSFNQASGLPLVANTEPATEAEHVLATANVDVAVQGVAVADIDLGLENTHRAQLAFVDRRRAG